MVFSGRKKEAKGCCCGSNSTAEEMIKAGEIKRTPASKCWDQDVRNVARSKNLFVLPCQN